MEHYCDRCGVPAKARWFKDGAELTFCGHHDHEYSENLNLAGWMIDIEYAREKNPELVNA